MDTQNPKYFLSYSIIPSFYPLISPIP